MFRLFALMPPLDFKWPSHGRPVKNSGGVTAYDLPPSPRLSGKGPSESLLKYVNAEYPYWLHH